MTLAPLTYLVSVALCALGVAYVVTGSKIGFPLRAWWLLVVGYVPLVRKLKALTFCSPCNAFWVGLGTALLTGSGWWVALQCAFVSCGVVAVAQGVAGIAADDEEDIKQMWQKIGKYLRGEETGNDNDGKHLESGR